MREEPRAFYSDGLRLDASLYLPDREPAAGTPTVIACSGFTGLKTIHPARFSRALTARGYPCFGFDYRGFGKSEGSAQSVLLDEQARDIVSAVMTVTQERSLAGRPVVLLGWGMGGGLVLQAAPLVRSYLAGLVAANGFFDAVRVQRAVRGSSGWEEFSGWYQKERAAAVQKTEETEIDAFRIYPLDDVSRGYVDSVLRKTDGYATTVKIGFADSLLSFRPEAHLEGLEDLPLLIAHGTQNALHSPEEARSLFARYPGPKELHWLEGAGHTEWMADDDPIFIALCDRLHAWLQTLG